MTLLFAFIVICFGAALTGLHFVTRLNRIKALSASQAPGVIPPPSRYRPMLRLLSEDDWAMVGGNKALAAKLRKQRITIFRQYLAALTVDYGSLLAGIREAMKLSGVDRPDLAAVLLKNRAQFTLAICRVEYRLFLVRFGVGSVDVSGLVDAIGALQNQLRIFNPTMAGAY